MSINTAYKFPCMLVLLVKKRLCMPLAKHLPFGYIKMHVNLQLDLRRKLSIARA